MKTCIKCGVEKPETEFYRNCASPDGKQNDCIICHKQKSANWYKNNKHRTAVFQALWKLENRSAIKIINQRYVAKNRAKLALRAKQWRIDNPKRAKEIKRQWNKKHPERCAMKVAKRNAVKIQATPAWANKGFIEDAYLKAAIFTKRDGKPWHVDHIVPLKSKLVCGLHCEDNLQVIPGKDNITKGNRHWSDMPGVCV